MCRMFFFSSRRRHTSCALVTVVQTCALPIYDNIRVGLNSRLDTLQAAIPLEKLKIFPAKIEAREKVAQRYTANLPAALRSQGMMPSATSVRYDAPRVGKECVRTYRSRWLSYP